MTWPSDLIAYPSQINYVMSTRAFPPERGYRGSPRHTSDHPGPVDAVLLMVGHQHPSAGGPPAGHPEHPGRRPWRNAGRSALAAAMTIGCGCPWERVGTPSGLPAKQVLILQV